MRKEIFALVLLSLIALSFADSSRPARPGSFMKITILDVDSGKPIAGGLLVRMEYSAPEQARNAQYITPVSAGSAPVSISFPPPEYTTTARIRATAPGYYNSTDEFTISSKSYWNSVQGTGEPDTSAWGADVVVGSGEEPEILPEEPASTYLAEHTFRLKKKPVETPAPKTSVIPPSPYGQEGGIFGMCPFLPMMAGAVLLISLISFRRKEKYACKSR